MNKSALLELASRCEAATGPDRDLDWAITQVRHPSANPHPRNPALFLLCDGHFRRSDFNYTASLDAAMSLVPEGWRFGLEQPGMFDGKQIEEAWCWPFESGFDPDWQNGQQGYRDAPEATHGFAATPALALTAAALRALAKEKGE